jgi:hypothetical protein
MKQASVSSTIHGGGKRRGVNRKLPNDPLEQRVAGRHSLHPLRGGGELNGQQDFLCNRIVDPREPSVGLKRRRKRMLNVDNSGRRRTSYRLPKPNFA